MKAVKEKTKGVVLVIDDDTLVRRMLCAALNKMEFETIEAPTGVSGLFEYKKYKPGIVITDLIMPDGNGFETILKIRAEDPDVRIIAMSSGGSSNDGDFLEATRELGARATIRKPFTVEDVRQALAVALKDSVK